MDKDKKYEKETQWNIRKKVKRIKEKQIRKYYEIEKKEENG